MRARFSVVALDLPGTRRGARARAATCRRGRSCASSVVPAMFTALARAARPARATCRTCCSATAWAGCSRSTTRSRTRARSWPRWRRRAGAAQRACRRGGSSRWANVARVTAPSAGFPHGLDESGMSRDPEVLALRAERPAGARPHQPAALLRVQRGAPARAARGAAAAGARRCCCRGWATASWTRRARSSSAPPRRTAWCG